MHQTVKKLALLLVGCWLTNLAQAQTQATNVRLRTEPTVRKVIVEYELPQVLPGDSIYLELETASGRVLRPMTLNGDVGNAIKAGKNKLIAWDVVRDNVRLDEDVKVLLRVARMVAVADPAGARTKPATTAANPPTPRPTTDRIAEPGSVVRKKSPLPLIGWVITGGLAGYATVLALGLNKDVDDYNSRPYAENAAELQQYKDQKAKIDKNKGTFTLVAGAAAAVGVANLIYTLVGKPKPARTSLLIRSGNQVTHLGIRHTF